MTYTFTVDMTIKKDKAKTTPTIDSNQLSITKTTSRFFHPLMINILFIIGGALFLTRIFQRTQVLNFIFAPIAIVLIFFTFITKPTRTEKDVYSTVAFSIWIIVSFIITIQADSEILFIFILIGFLIIQELSQDKLTQHFQKRLNVLLVIFIMVFIVIVADKIQIILTS